MLRFEKGDKTPIQLRVLVPICSVLLGLLMGSVVMLFAHVNPLRVYGAIVKGAFGSAYTFSETLVIAVPLILISSGLCLVYRMKFFNIGAKGQYIICLLYTSDAADDLLCVDLGGRRIIKKKKKKKIIINKKRHK